MSEELQFSEEVDENDDVLDKIKEREIRSQSRDETVEALLNAKNKGKLILQPDFQRHYVWDSKKASSLMESAMMNIPIPVVYLAEDETGKRLVIDGQQRLTSFFNFIEGKFSLSALGVFSELKGKSFQELEEPLKDKICECPIPYNHFPERF